MNVREQTVLSSLRTHARSRPDAPAFVDGTRVISYGRLVGDASRAAAFLRATGVAAGEMVAIDLTSDADEALRSLVFVYAIAWLGASMLPLYPGVPDARRAQILAHLQPNWLLSGGKAPRKGKRIARIDPAGLVLGAGGRERARRADDPARPFEVSFSSGTTGVPRAVLHSQGQIARRMQTITDCLGGHAGDRLLPAKPWPSGVGLRWIWRAHRCGAAFLNLPFPTRRGALARLIERFGITGIGASPWQARYWLTETSLVAPLPLRFLDIGGAPATAAEIAALRKYVTPHVWVTFGTTESGFAGVVPPSDPVDAPFRPAPGTEVQIVDKHRQPLPVGVEGELRYRNAWTAPGYLGDEAASAERFGGGWFHTRDRGVLDARGRFRVRGRLDDIINQGGNKITPGDIESTLMALPEVEDVAVIGIPDRMSGEAAIACLVLRTPGALAEVIDAMRGQIARSSWPLQVVEVSRIPRNAGGKIMRGKLRERVLRPVG